MDCFCQAMVNSFVDTQLYRNARRYHSATNNQALEIAYFLGSRYMLCAGSADSGQATGLRGSLSYYSSTITLVARRRTSVRDALSTAL